MFWTSLHLAGAHRSHHTTKSVQMVCVVGAFVAREVGRTWCVVFVLAVLASCAGHDDGFVSYGLRCSCRDVFSRAGKCEGT